MSQESTPTSPAGEASAGYWSNRIHLTQTDAEVTVTGTQFKGDPPQIRETLKAPRHKFIWQKERQAWVYDRDPARLGEAAEAIRDVLAALDRQAEADGVMAPADKPRFPPTPQQQAIIEAVTAGHDVAVLALAGTGKTTTMRLVAEALPDSKITYLAFNRAIAEEATEAMPRNVTAVTSHAIAKRALSSGPLGVKLRRVGKVKVGKGRNERRFARWPEQIAPVLGITGPHTIGEDTYTPENLTQLAMATVEDYRKSAADHIGPNNLPYAVRHNTELAPLILRYAQAAWADICSPDGQLIFEHDDYRKIWIESRPIIDADLIIFDEAQDINPVLAKLVQNQPTQTIVVGDSYQSIYGFTGAVDALATWPADTVLPLTQSWRFGPEAAEVGNQFLRLLGADLQLRGNPALDTALGRVDAPDAVLTRTNAGAVAAVIEAMDEEKKVALVGGGKAIEDIANAAKDLQYGKGTDHPELSRFTTWKQVIDAVENDPDARSLQMFVRLVNRYSPDGLIRMVADLVPETSQDPDNQPDVVVSTAHKAKGREWDNVRIGGDFPQPTLDEETGQLVLPAPEELRLDYVTVTRGKKRLELGSLEWVFDPAGAAGHADHEPGRAPSPPLAARAAAPTAVRVTEPPTVEHAADQPAPDPTSPPARRRPRTREPAPEPPALPGEPASPLVATGHHPSGEALPPPALEARAPEALTAEPDAVAARRAPEPSPPSGRQPNSAGSGQDDSPPDQPYAAEPDQGTGDTASVAAPAVAAIQTDGEPPTDTPAPAATPPATPLADPHDLLFLPAGADRPSEAELQDSFEDVMTLFAERDGHDLDTDEPIPTGPYASAAAERTARAFNQLKHALADGRLDIIAAIEAAASNALGDTQPDAQPGRNTRGPALPPELEPLHQALRDAHANSSWYYTTPQWQQITAITAAVKALGNAITAAPGSYLHQLAHDVRARGFMQAVTARACRMIAQSCQAIAAGLQKAGLGETPGWLAIQGLHNRAADFADQLMGALPPGWTLQTLDGLRHSWDTLRSRLGRTTATGQTTPAARATAGTVITASAIAGLRTAMAATATQASRTRAWQRLSNIWDAALPVLSQIHQGTLRFETDAQDLGLLKTAWLRTCELTSFTARGAMDRIEAGDTRGAPGPRWHALRLLRHTAEQNIAHLRDELAPGEHAPLGTYDQQTAGRGNPPHAAEPPERPEQPDTPPAPRPATPAAPPAVEPPADVPARQEEEASPPPVDRNWVATEYLAGRPPRDEQAARLYRHLKGELTRTTDPAVLDRLTAKLNAYDAYEGPMTWTQWTAAQVANASAARPDRVPAALAAVGPASQARTTAIQAKAGFPQGVREQLRAAKTTTNPAAPTPSPPDAGAAITTTPKGPER